MPAQVEQVLVPFGVWGLAMLGVLVAAGIVLGVLRAWHAVLGDNSVAHRRGAITLALAAVGLALATALLAPVFDGHPAGGRVALALAAGSLPLAIFTRTRPLACAIAAAELVAALVASIAADLWIVHVRTPDLVVLGLGLLFALTAAPAGWALGLHLTRGATTSVDVRAGVAGTFARVRRAVYRVAARAAKWTAIPAAIGILGAVWIVTHSSSAANAAGPWLLVGVLVAPLVIVGASLLYWSWATWWTAPAEAWGAAALALTRAVATRVRNPAQRLLVIVRYPRALCDTCLRWSESLESTYEGGRRMCEKCGGEISFAGGPGKLVVEVCEPPQSRAAPDRVFVRRADEVVAAAEPVDVTHIRLEANDALTPEFESLVMFLLNEEPSQGIEGVEVYPVRGREALPLIVTNLVSNQMTWTEVDPLTASTPESRLTRLWKRVAPKTHDAPDEWPVSAKVRRIAIGAVVGGVLLLAPRLLLSVLGMPFALTRYEWGRQLTYHDATGAIVHPSLWDLTWHLKFPLAAALAAAALLAAALLIGWHLWWHASRHRRDDKPSSSRHKAHKVADDAAGTTAEKRPQTAFAEGRYIVCAVALALPLLFLAGMFFVLVL